MSGQEENGSGLRRDDDSQSSEERTSPNGGLRRPCWSRWLCDCGTRWRPIQPFHRRVQIILVAAREKVRRSHQIAAVGTSGEQYLAHLHFEMREPAALISAPAIARTPAAGESKLRGHRGSRYHTFYADQSLLFRPGGSSIMAR